MIKYPGTVLLKDVGRQIYRTIIYMHHFLAYHRAKQFNSWLSNCHGDPRCCWEDILFQYMSSCNEM